MMISSIAWMAMFTSLVAISLGLSFIIGSHRIRKLFPDAPNEIFLGYFVGICLVILGVERLINDLAYMTDLAWLQTNVFGGSIAFVLFVFTVGIGHITEIFRAPTDELSGLGWRLIWGGSLVLLGLGVALDSFSEFLGSSSLESLGEAIKLLIFVLFPLVLLLRFYSWKKTRNSLGVKDLEETK